MQLISYKVYQHAHWQPMCCLKQLVSHSILSQMDSIFIGLCMDIMALTVQNWHLFLPRRIQLDVYHTKQQYQ